MKRTEINIRDPFVLCHEGTYYLYGTRSATCWGEADGFDCYVSRDLENWEGPVEVFRRPEGFWADRCYWAPECYAYGGAFYLITTLGAGDRKTGVYALRAASPVGPFEIYSGCLTPEDWNCIDGTLYFENGHPYLVFSRSQHGAEDGDYDVLELSEDLKTAVSAPVRLFTAKEAPWSKPVPFAKAEFGIDEMYFSDGPFLMKLEDARLYMIFSSWSVNGYAVGVAVSEEGVYGPWKLLETPLYPENGGHGMLFRDCSGRLLFSLHYPNDKYQEHPIFLRAELGERQIRLLPE